MDKVNIKNLLKQFYEVNLKLEDKYLQLVDIIEWEDVDFENLTKEIVKLEQNHVEILHKLIDYKKDSKESKELIQLFSKVSNLTQNLNKDNLKELYDLYNLIGDKFNLYLKEIL